jgi:hypothetical protein
VPEGGSSSPTSMAGDQMEPVSVSSPVTAGHRRAQARRHLTTSSSTVTEVHDEALISTTPWDAAPSSGMNHVAFEWDAC